MKYRQEVNQAPPPILPMNNIFDQIWFTVFRGVLTPPPLQKHILMNPEQRSNTHEEDKVEEEQEVLGRRHAAFAHGCRSVNRRSDHHNTD